LDEEGKILNSEAVQRDERQSNDIKEVARGLICNLTAGFLHSHAFALPVSHMTHSPLYMGRGIDWITGLGF
jgi:hypothetical protein